MIMTAGQSGSGVNVFLGIPWISHDIPGNYCNMIAYAFYCVFLFFVHFHGQVYFVDVVALSYLN